MGFTVVVTPARKDLRRLVRRATRRTRVVFLLLGSLLAPATILALSDGDPAPFLAGMLTAVPAGALLIVAVLLPWQIGRRLPAVAREQWTCTVDGTGIRMRGSTWDTRLTWTAFRKTHVSKAFVTVSREPGLAALTLPRSALTPEQEAELLAILTDLGLLPGRDARR